MLGYDQVFCQCVSTGVQLLVHSQQGQWLGAPHSKAVIN